MLAWNASVRPGSSQSSHWTTSSWFYSFEIAQTTALVIATSRAKWDAAFTMVQRISAGAIPPGPVAPRRSTRQKAASRPLGSRYALSKLLKKRLSQSLHSDYGRSRVKTCLQIRYRTNHSVPARRHTNEGEDR